LSSGRERFNKHRLMADVTLHCYKFDTLIERGSQHKNVKPWFGQERAHFFLLLRVEYVVDKQLQTCERMSLPLHKTGEGIVILQEKMSVLTMKM
jgi:hypothetical protein